MVCLEAKRVRVIPGSGIIGTKGGVFENSTTAYNRLFCLRAFLGKIEAYGSNPEIMSPLFGIDDHYFLTRLNEF